MADRHANILFYTKVFLIHGCHPRFATERLNRYTKFTNKLGEYYVNARGQEWQLPTDGEYRFTASSGEYPKFTGGVVSPLKVRVGDTQLMQVRIEVHADVFKF
jgi:hypothetical protein